MSKYLGFIHYIMFDKIKFQEKIVKEILNIAKNKGNYNIEKEVDKLGTIEDGKLEDIIDSDNIHAWLQKRVELVENRFAKTVALILKDDTDSLEEIKGLLHNLGKKESKPSTVKEGYKLISSKFLDGMPCDNAIIILEDTEDLLSFKIIIDKHSNFWVKYDVMNIYWDLRNEYIKGIFDSSNYRFNKVDDYLYEIGRK
ncbi:hypothetical protein [Miniphocaeibacter massiliensis]|uniref:hypothetical protein n=1 Tax=Miniphocaeibacter massiliensis TaxID=2041841 RepID=UPI000C1C83B7|nr:hypothetical protein [Miniphocaeibacter massiliensis]